MSYHAEDPAERQDARDQAVHQAAEALAALHGISYEDAFAQADAELLDEPMTRRQRDALLKLENLP